MPVSNQLTLETDSSVYLLCPGGFNLDGLSETNKFTIEVRCKENEFTEYRSLNDGSEFRDNKQTSSSSYDRYGRYVGSHTENSRIYTCERKALQLFLGNEEGSLCDQASYAVGYQLGDKVIILMEICYNAIDKKIDFIHFIQSNSNHPISEYYNPVNVSATNHASLPVAEFFERLPNILSKMGQMSRLFTIDSLNQFSIFENYPSTSFSSLNRITTLVWLKDLIDGQTLKIFNELLRKRKEDVQYEIFVGTSDKIPSSHTPSNCIHEAYSKEVNIPKYIWTYLQSKDDEVDEKFVVIGVNTPFAGHNSWNETVFCKDMCGTIDWLKPIEKIRQMPYMGIIFCCEATEEVKTLLEGFPKTNDS